MSKNTTKNKLSKNVINAIYNNDIAYLEKSIEEENKENSDSDNRTAIFHAVLSGNLIPIKFLIEKEVEINLKDKIGWTPLHYAVQNNFLPIAEILIQYGASLEAKDDYGNTPLWRAVFSSGGKGEMIQLLLNEGADPDNPNHSNISPLKLANSIANYDVKSFFGKE